MLRCRASRPTQVAQIAKHRVTNIPQVTSKYHITTLTAPKTCGFTESELKLSPDGSEPGRNGQSPTPDVLHDEKYMGLSAESGSARIVKFSPAFSVGIRHHGLAANRAASSSPASFDNSIWSTPRAPRGYKRSCTVLWGSDSFVVVRDFALGKRISISMRGARPASPRSYYVWRDYLQQIANPASETSLFSGKVMVDESPLMQ
ncbi:uncharacterized protein BCR38DRAFT_409061 [Pseudomassariella vexata]|uniref:Uncharacterized protein n=1 Tax=Pseudomassariella vexata TaxID=1141098 RepID=A0A1Y2E1C3_9PEZI|nr:uncharacterized protein BCR38DRAFT_409061 [Pseudomassariella vexata]ORY65353.1 hypothetical protein BCR38DRAFT_409061 [Pseudomassariella vexata]